MMCMCAKDTRISCLWPALNPPATAARRGAGVHFSLSKPWVCLRGGYAGWRYFLGVRNCSIPDEHNISSGQFCSFPWELLCCRTGLHTVQQHNSRPTVLTPAGAPSRVPRAGLGLAGLGWALLGCGQAAAGCPVPDKGGGPSATSSSRSPARGTDRTSALGGLLQPAPSLPGLACLRGAPRADAWAVRQGSLYLLYH